MAASTETWIDLGSRISKGFEIDRDRDEDMSVSIDDDDIAFDGFMHDPSGEVLFEFWDNVIGGCYGSPGNIDKYGTAEGWFISHWGKPLISVYFKNALIDGEQLRLATIEADFYGEDACLVIHATRDQFEILEPDRVDFEHLRAIA